MGPLPVKVGNWANMPRTFLYHLAKSADGKKSLSSRAVNGFKRESRIRRTKESNIEFDLVKKLPTSISKKTKEYLKSIAQFKRTADKAKHMNTALNQMFDERPIWLTNPLKKTLPLRVQNLMGDHTVVTSAHMTTDMCRDRGIYFISGPWKNSFVKWGYDPRIGPQILKGNTNSSSSSSSSSKVDTSKAWTLQTADLRFLRDRRDEWLAIMKRLPSNSLCFKFLCGKNVY